MQPPVLERTPSGKAGNERRQNRSKLNLKELNAMSLFEQFDTNKSGVLEPDQFKQMLVYLNDGNDINEQEFRLLMQVSDKNHDERISKLEVQFAIASWFGYTLLRDKYKDVFKQFDVDQSGNLDEKKMKELLTSLNDGIEVPIDQARKVCLKAKAMGNSGVIGEEQLLGAVGLWYMQVEREPTPAPAVAMQVVSTSVQQSIPPEIRWIHKIFNILLPFIFVGISYGFFQLHDKYKHAKCTAYHSDAPFATLFLIYGFSFAGLAVLLMPFVILGVEALMTCVVGAIYCCLPILGIDLVVCAFAGTAFTMNIEDCDKSLHHTAVMVFVVGPLVSIVLLSCCCCMLCQAAAAIAVQHTEAESALQAGHGAQLTDTERWPLSRNIA